MSRNKKDIESYLDDDFEYVPKNEKVIYILGPMRGYPNLNFDEFHRYAHALRESGWVVFNPAETVMGLKSPKAYIMLDIAVVAECDAIFRLKGWEASKGARVEVALADYLGLQILDEGDY